MKPKFCPKCKSEDVEIKITTSASYGSPQNWKCNDCGFSAPEFPELKKKTKKK
ncbi:Uncharacterised protein [uncultured archaeon]|nr:Uncharacterised protein [uncultured archaeon]